jgi:hypothetical protein
MDLAETHVDQLTRPNIAKVVEKPGYAGVLSAEFEYIQRSYTVRSPPPLNTGFILSDSAIITLVATELSWYEFNSACIAWQLWNRRLNLYSYVI